MKNLLRITILTGVILFVLTGITLSAFYLIERSGSRVARQQDSFNRILREFDSEFEVIVGLEREFEYLNNELDKLEKRAISVESWLSILKRRRAIARIHPPSVNKNKDSISRALEAYPLSQQIAAIAAENLIREGAITVEAEQKLRLWLSFLNDLSFNDLRLGIHVLLGDFRDPHRGSLVSSDIFTDGTEDINLNLALLKILRSDSHGAAAAAAADVQLMTQSPSLSVNALRFAAEYHYDFGDLNRSAEFFHRINDDRAMIREADALYLSGYRDSARRIWLHLADSNQYTEQSLYNLAVTCDETSEVFRYLDRLINIDPIKTDAGQYGLIRYSRMLDDKSAIELLTGTKGLSADDYPFIALEVNRRQMPYWRLERQISQAWYLLDRHPDNEDLYRWAGWLILFQRNYSEIEMLLGRHEMQSFSPNWQNLYRAILLMFEGYIEDAEELLRSIPPQEAEWAVSANIGRILEARRMPVRALEQYEKAIEMTDNPKTIAALFLRIARCYTAIGRPGDTLRSIQRALDIDPGNLNARMELDRLLY